MMENLYPFKPDDSKLLKENGFEIEMHPHTEAFATKKGTDSAEYMVCLNEDGTFTASKSEEWMSEPEVNTVNTIKECLDWLGL